MTPRAAGQPVGRPREFDEDEVLAAAMVAFWSHGYEATSMADLCECTGLHKGSLYQTFGDKHSLFMRALRHYADTEFKEVADVAYAESSPLGAIRALMHKVVDNGCGERGCLMINSLVELAPHDPEVKRYLETLRDQRIKAMRDLIEKARAAGEIPPDADVGRLSARLMVTLAGVATTVKGFMTIAQAHDVVDDAVDSLM